MWQYRILFVLIFSFILLETQAQGSIFNEAPMLAEQVARGELPPIEERLPINPVIIQPIESIGQYGGIWSVGIKREGDNPGIFRHIGYENLVRWDPTWTRVIPNIASSVTLNADATEYTFTLRQGMRWSDGALFTADDIVFWYEAVFSNESLVQNYSRLRNNIYFIHGNPVTVEKLDDLTVVFRFASPYGLFLRNLASPYGGDPSRFPRHYLQEFHSSYNPNAEALAHEAGFQSWQEFFVSKVGDEAGGVGYEADPNLPRLDAWIHNGLWPRTC